MKVPFRTQDGFSAVEGFIIVIVLVVIGGAGFMMVKRHANSDPKPTTTSTAAPAAPEIKSTGDLTKAEQTLDDTNIEAASTDSAQLDAQLNGF